MKETRKQRGLTVALAADVGGCSMATLGLAVGMAASMKTRLRGFFVEDEDLLRVTGLPFTREISLATARDRPTDPLRMQRRLRSLAADFEQALKREAGALQIGCSFEYVRGRIHEIGRDSGTEFTCTIIDRGLARFRRLPANAAAGRILWIPGSDSDNAETMHLVLKKLAQQALEVVLIEDHPPADLRIDPQKALGKKGDAIAVQSWTEQQLLERLDAGVRFECAVISRRQAADKLSRLLKTLTCPVILVA